MGPIRKLMVAFAVAGVVAGCSTDTGYQDTEYQDSGSGSGSGSVTDASTYKAHCVEWNTDHPDQYTDPDQCASDAAQMAGDYVQYQTQQGR